MAEEKSLALPLRPGQGQGGRPIKLLANHYETSLKSKDVVHLYIVAADVELPRKSAARIFPELRRQFPDDFSGVTLAHDDEKLVYTNAEFPFKEKVFPLKFGKGPLSVTVKKVSTLRLADLSDYVQGKLKEFPRDAVQAIEVILSQFPKTSLIAAGRGYFDGKNMADISDGAQIWFGYRQSVKIGQGKVYLNVDVANSAFLTPKPLLEFIRDIEGGRSIEELIKRNRGTLPQDLVKKVNRKLRGLQIEVSHLAQKRKFKVNGLISKNAVTYKFPPGENEELISVAEYFHNRFGISLNYPEMPLLHVGPTKKDIMLPVEVCSIAKGQRITKLTPRQTADVIRQAAKKPDERLKLIEKSESVLRDSEQKSIANEFGIGIGRNLAQVQGRILNPPKIVYSSDSKEAEVSARGGQWRAENSKFYRAATLTRWAIVSFEKDRFFSERHISDLVRAFDKYGAECGVTFREKKPPIVFGDPRTSRSIQDTIRDAVKLAVESFGEHPQILFVFLPPTSGSALYGDIKKVCETEVDVPSQCMLVKKATNPKGQAQYVKNVLLKVNAKLGGTNWIIERTAPWAFFMSKPAILFGADVTHGAAGSKMPSIASLVASMDASCSRYAAVVRSQQRREEVIVNLKDMVRGMLLKFYKGTGGKKPEKVLFYRDGVSDGQFDAVLNSEVSAIKEACSSLEAGYNPPVTFVVVKKRHHTRLFTANPRDADRSGNIPAGTVVDSVITHPSQFDFFLCSHAGLQGTSRPCHYHVLFDENKFTADRLQDFSNQLCYTYVRCTKAVSLVPPVYYAHLSAFRAKYHSNADFSDEYSTTSDGASDVSSVEFMPVKPRTDSVMYFV